MATTRKISSEESLAIVEKMRQERVSSVKNFFTGMAKAVTTDLPGFLMDVADKLAGDTSTLGEKDRSAQLFETMTGIKTKSGAGGVDELVGSIVNPVGAAKAVIVPAALLGKNVELAQKLTKAGMSPATVFDQTGIYKESGKWKAAMSDKEASINQTVVDDRFRALGKVLDHPDLYTLYPDMQRMSITAAAKGEGGAMYSPEYNTIGIDPFLPEQDFKSILLHEVQHAIQQKEKFKKGGSPEQFRITDPNITPGAAYELYRKLPGEQEASFVERTSNMTQAQLAYEIKKLLQAAGTPGNQSQLAADLDRFTNP